MQLEILSFCDRRDRTRGQAQHFGRDRYDCRTPLCPRSTPRCAIAMRFRVSRVEEGEHAVRLMLIDMDGGALTNMDGKMNIQMATAMTVAVNLIINFNNLELKRGGRICCRSGRGRDSHRVQTAFRARPATGTDCYPSRDSGVAAHRPTVCCILSSA